MKTITPTVSVIMPVYNTDDYLAQAIESVLNQTYSDFELIIVCDNPSEKTYQILNHFQKADQRIVVYFDENKGLSESRNFGCSVAQGEYIAWIDADDICLSNRLEIQVSYLNNHQDIGICGSYIRIISNEKEETLHFPLTDHEIRCAMLFFSPFANSSVIMRKKILDHFDKIFNPDFKLAEDYDLWVRCMKYTCYANINSELVKYRLHPNSISQIRKEDMQKFTKEVKKNLFINLGFYPTDSELDLHESISSWKFQRNKEYLKEVETWLDKIINNNSETKIFPEEHFNNILGDRWYSACANATNLGLWTWRIYWKSHLHHHNKLNYYKIVKFYCACLVRFAQ